MDLQKTENPKIKYLNSLFESNVVEEFEMTNEDVDALLTQDQNGEDIVEMYTPFMDMFREMKAIRLELGEINNCLSSNS